MTASANIALDGDYDAAITAHQAIPLALEITAESLAINITSSWIPSGKIDLNQLRQCRLIIEI